MKAKNTIDLSKYIGTYTVNQMPGIIKSIKADIKKAKIKKKNKTP